jgi:ATP-binding cassette subfamily B protein/subfamily B ATP-binding cassette protein MsbA
LFRRPVRAITAACDLNWTRPLADRYTDLIAPTSDDPQEPRSPAASTGLMSRFWNDYLRPNWRRMSLAFLIMMIDGSTLGVMSYLIKPLFDDVFTSGEVGGLVMVGGMVLALFVVRATMSVTAQILITTTSQKVVAAMQTTLLRHSLTLDGAFFQKNAPGVLIERIRGDTLAVQGLWVKLLQGVGRDLVALIGLLTVAVMIDPIWTLATLVGVPLLVLPAVALQRYIRKKSRQTREQAGLRSSRLDEIFHGIQAVKLNRLEDYQLDRYRAILKLINRSELRSATGRAMMPALVDVVSGIGFFAVLVLAGSQVATGERTTGEFMSFFAAMSLTFQPIRRLGDLSGLWQQAAASLERIYELTDMRPRQNRPAEAATLPAPGAPQIEFRDVTFAYDDQPVLRGLSFTAEAGQMTALVGASGAGKTTIFHLLTGLSDPSGGQIAINGVDVQTLPLAVQRSLFASVSQDSALFDETLRENILLGQTGVSPERLAEAVKAAHVADFAAQMPKGLDTPAGPRGSGLSGGQRQRVAIARALMRDAPVLLLDEATSALDSQSEAIVAEALTRLGRGRTTLVIAHRLSTVRDAAKIVVLDRGQVAEEGTHDALLAKGGLYAQLHALQFRD